MEGPQIHWYTRHLLPPLAGRTVDRVSGRRAEVNRVFTGGTIAGTTGRGKLIFLRFTNRDQLLRLHCLMFGDLRINRTRPGKTLTLKLHLAGPAAAPRLLSRGNGRPTPRSAPDTLRLYLGAARPADPAELDELEPTRRGDALDPRYDGAAVLADAAAAEPRRPVSDVMLDQALFPGLGNKIKAEALWLARLHPMTRVGSLTPARRAALAGSILDYTRVFLDAVHEQGDHCYPPPHVFRRKICPRCGNPIQTAHLGDPPRKCHWCAVCQPLAA